MDDKAIRELFRMEGMEHVESIESALLAYEESDRKPDLMADMSRYLHTLKGSGNMAGFLELGDYVHQLESDFAQYRDGKKGTGPAFVTRFLEACDHLRQLILAEPGQEVDKKPKGTTVPAVQGSMDSDPRRHPRTWRLAFTPPRELFIQGISARALFDELGSLGPLELQGLEDDIPGLEALDPEACYLAWEARLSSSAPEESIREIFAHAHQGGSLTLEPDAPGAQGLSNRPGRRRRKSFGILRALVCTVGQSAFLVPADGIRSCRPAEGNIRKPIGISVIDGHQETVFDLPTIFDLQSGLERILVLVSHEGQSFCLAVEAFEDFIEGTLQTAIYPGLTEQGVASFVIDERNRILQVLDLDWFLEMHRRVEETLKHQGRNRTKSRSPVVPGK